MAMGSMMSGKRMMTSSDTATKTTYAIHHHHHHHAGMRTPQKKEIERGHEKRLGKK
jgi:SRSO17 transposase